MEGGRKMADDLRSTTDRAMREMDGHEQNIHGRDMQILIYAVKYWPTTIPLFALLFITAHEANHPAAFAAASLWTWLMDAWGWKGLLAMIAVFCVYPYLAPPSKRPPLPAMFFAFGATAFASYLQSQNHGHFGLFLGTAAAAFVTLIVARSKRAKRLFEQSDDEDRPKRGFVAGEGLKAWGIALGVTLVSCLGLFLADSPYREKAKATQVETEKKAEAKDVFTKRIVAEATIYLGTGNLGGERTWFLATVPADPKAEAVLIGRGKIETATLSPQLTEFLYGHGTERFAVATVIAPLAQELRKKANGPIRLNLGLSNPKSMEIVWKAFADMDVDLVPYNATQPINLDMLADGVDDSDKRPRYVMGKSAMSVVSSYDRKERLANVPIDEVALNSALVRTSREEFK